MKKIQNSSKIFQKCPILMNKNINNNYFIPDYHRAQPAEYEVDDVPQEPEIRQ